MKEVNEKETETEAEKESIEQETVSAEEVSIDIEELLAKLVPPDEVVILDIFGNEYKKPSVVSARKQIKVIRSFQNALSFVGKTELKGSSTSSMIDFIVEIATDDRIMESIGECFTFAYPDVVQSSLKYAKKKKVSVEDNAALDLFSIEDIAGSIIPLFMRLAKKSGGALKILTNLT
jgi:hypothetical protein